MEKYKSTFVIADITTEHYDIKLFSNSKVYEHRLRRQHVHSKPYAAIKLDKSVLSHTPFTPQYLL